jgi:GT2 family glycosyltransferase
MSIRVSVIIATYNRSGQIINTLLALSQQSIPKEEMEVIIVDDGSNDTTQFEVEQYLHKNPNPLWKYIQHSENSGKASALNTGIKEAIASLVVFTDDDCVPSPNWVEAHINKHESEYDPISVLGSVSFPLEWVKRSNFIRYANTKYINFEKIKFIGGDPNDLSPRFFGGLNISIPKKQIIEVGLFNESIGRGQDVELGYRLWKSGIKLVYEPNASIIHFEPESHSLRERIQKTALVYQNSLPIINEIHPQLINEFGNWFLEPINFKVDPYKRIFVKLLFRLSVNKIIANFWLNFLERTDKYSFMYFPFFYNYVFASACLENVKRRKI